MPTYSYLCEKCNNSFELFFYIKDYTEKPKCSHCNSHKTNRKYLDDVMTQSTSVRKSDSELKTIGDLANRNRDKMSEDHKNDLYHKHNEYKESGQEDPLPQGMKRLKKQKKVKWT